jgi:hypothetical protein
MDMRVLPHLLNGITKGYQVLPASGRGKQLKGYCAPSSHAITSFWAATTPCLSLIGPPMVGQVLTPSQPCFSPVGFLGMIEE